MDTEPKTSIPLSDHPTSSSSSPSSHPPLPELPYNPRDHKLGIAISWTIIFLDSCIVPIALTYALWYHTSLSQNAIFGIITGAVGVVSFIEYYVRLYKLLRKDDKLRPLGSKRGWLDYFQISYTLGIIVVVIELVIACSHQPLPLIRLISIPPTTLILMISVQLLSFVILGALGFRTQFRVSSLPRGVPIRPGIYTIIEDVIAVDAGVGRPYREALNARYEASPHFRRMLWKLNLFWSVSGVVIGVIMIGIVFAPGVSHLAAFGVGWTVPFVWAGLMALGTIFWVKVELKREKEGWGKGGA